jgi:hypothetical protein
MMSCFFFVSLNDLWVPFYLLRKGAEDREMEMDEDEKNITKIIQSFFFIFFFFFIFSGGAGDRFLLLGTEG